jgi:hypothetical protein
MHVHGNATTVVTDGHGTVYVDGYLNLAAKPGEMLVDGIVQDLEDAMMQAALIGVADIHSGAFAHRLQPLQFINF